MTNIKRKEIFIGGAPRSGTTLLGAMLGSHSKMIATPESQFKFELSQAFQEKELSIEEIQNAFEDNKRFRLWKFQPDFKTAAGKSLPDIIHGIVDQYATHEKKRDSLFWVDHTPANVRHATFLGEHYPGCKFIHIVRDGRGVYASQRQLDFGSNDPFFAALKWTEALAAGFACETTYPERCIRVYFEKLLTNPQSECKRLCDFIGVEYEPEMISGKGFAIPSYTQHQHQLVGKAPDLSKIDEWKNLLSPKEIYFFESMTYDLLPMLGYEKVNPGWLEKPTEITQSIVMIKGALKYLTIDKLRLKRRMKKNS